MAFAINSPCRLESLLQSSVIKVVENFDNNIENVGCLPPSIKDRITHLMCKRGLLTDANIGFVIHSKTGVLDLSESDVSDVALHTVANRCRLLQKVDLNSNKGFRTSITSLGVIALAHSCPYLQVVYLQRCLHVTDDVIVALSERCPMLRDLNIGHCEDISDTTLQSLGRHSKHLRSINMSASKVTDCGMMALVGGCCSNSLKEIHMTQCRHVTDEAVEAIVQFCPNIAILLFSGCPQLTDRSRLALETLAGDNSLKQVTWTVY